MISYNKWKIILAFAAIYIIWGSTYLAIRISLTGIPPFLMSAIRFLLAGVVLYAWCLLKKQQQPGFSSLRKNALCGLLMLFGGTVSVVWAEQYLPSSLAAIIVTSMPFWFIVLDKKQWSFYFSNKIILAGLAIGFIGVIILVGFDRSSNNISGDSAKKVYGALTIIAGGIMWTIGSLYSKYSPAGNSVLINASVQLLVAGLFSLIVSFFTDEFTGFNFGNVTVDAWSAMLYLAIIGSLVAYLCYLWLLKVRPAAQVSTYVYINPIIALLLGVIIANEQITWLQVTALTIILCGVLLVNKAKYKSETSEHLNRKEE